MNNEELIKKVHTSADAELNRNGYVSIVNLLMDLGYLKKEKYEDWCFGRVDYLERVCTCNLHKLTLICKETRKYCLSLGCKGSYTVYKRWGKRNRSNKKPLRFSKSGLPEIEKAYATHYVGMAKLKRVRGTDGSADTEI